MDTQIARITPENREEVIDRAARLLQEGKVVAIPTETVYGLAASAFSNEAVGGIYAVKGRPADNPLIVHVSNLVMLREVANAIPESAVSLIKRFWPGPLTLVLGKTAAVSSVVTCGLDTVAVRMPSNKTAADIIEHAGLPLAAPSANLSGKPSPTTARHVMDDLSGKIPLIVDDGPCEIGLESTVVSLTGETPVILRPGMITLEQLQEVLPGTTVSDAVLTEVENDAKVESPGMKYKHYSPRADVVIVEGTLDQFAEYTARKAALDTYAMCFDGEEEHISIPSVSYGDRDHPEIQAKRLFSVLRAIDRFGATSVFVRCPQKDGVSLAVYNRLLRAAGYKVVKL